MIRLVIRLKYRVGYDFPSREDLRSFEIDHPEMERLLRSGGCSVEHGSFSSATLDGVEILDHPDTDEPPEGAKNK